jgi:hypothetical protein
MIILMTLLIAGTSMAFAVHQWWRGYHLIAMAGVAVETAKNTKTPGALSCASDRCNVRLGLHALATPAFL